eukprot:1703242-Pyramimonas_sp.AAC.1
MALPAYSQGAVSGTVSGCGQRCSVRVPSAVESGCSQRYSVRLRHRGAHRFWVAAAASRAVHSARSVGLDMGKIIGRSQDRPIAASTSSSHIWPIGRQIGGSSQWPGRTTTPRDSASSPPLPNRLLFGPLRTPSGPPPDPL